MVNTTTAATVRKGDKVTISTAEGVFIVGRIAKGGFVALLTEYQASAPYFGAMGYTEYRASKFWQIATSINGQSIENGKVV